MSDLRKHLPDPLSSTTHFAFVHASAPLMGGADVDVDGMDESSTDVASEEPTP